METIITTKKVKCDNCGNYIRQPKYHKEMIGICCWKCFNMPKHKYYEIVLFKYFHKIQELEKENSKLRDKLDIADRPRMPEPDLTPFRKKYTNWKTYNPPPTKYDYTNDGKIIIKFD